MFFLLRVAFWLSIVLVLLPSGQSQTQSKRPGAFEAVSAAGAAMSDMSQFCVRQPEACVVGAQAAVAFGERAQAGAKMVYEFLTEKASGEKNAPVQTGSVKAASAKPSQHTLAPADLKPEWRGPRKNAQASGGKGA
jgi:hypothetical protein